MIQNIENNLSVLQNVTKADVRLEPFPHIVIKDALPKALFEKLYSTMPSLKKVSKGQELASNERYIYSPQDFKQDEEVETLWHDFVSYHSSPEFFYEFLDLFEEYILDITPGIRDRVDSLRDANIGRHRLDNFDQKDILLDCSLNIYSPVFGKPSSFRGPHIDKPHFIFGGLLYMRDPEDRSKGGDLDIYKYKGSDHKFHFAENHPELRGIRYDIEDKYVEKIDTVKYDQNVLVMYPINPLALHGVSTREITPYQRTMVGMSASLENGFFTLET